MAVTDWNTTAANNTTVGSVPLGENLMDPSDVNDAIREIMAQIAQGIDDGDFATVSGLQTEDATLTALAALTTAANKGIYATGSDAFSTFDLTAFGRTLGGLADVAALKTLLGVVTVTSASLAGNGYLKLNISGTDFVIQWGTFTASANTTTTVSFPTSFASFSRAVCNGVGEFGTGTQATQPTVRSSSLSSFQAFSGSDNPCTCYFIAVGV